MLRNILFLVALASTMSVTGCGAGDVSFSCNCSASLPKNVTKTVILPYCGPDNGDDVPDTFASNDCQKKEPTATSCQCVCTTNETSCSTPSM